jgi:hypothetical protein
MAMIAIEKRGGSKEKLPPKLRNQEFQFNWNLRPELIIPYSY